MLYSGQNSEATHSAVAAFVVMVNPLFKWLEMTTFLSGFSSLAGPHVATVLHTNYRPVTG